MTQSYLVTTMGGQQIHIKANSADEALALRWEQLKDAARRRGISLARLADSFPHHAIEMQVLTMTREATATDLYSGEQDG